MTVGELAQLKAAAFDVEQALTEFLGADASNCAAWRTVTRLLDVFVTGEILRVGTRRKVDGSARERRPLGAACRLVGATERFAVSQILRARNRAERNGQQAKRSRKRAAQ